MPNKRDITEIFGYSPDDLTPSVRELWSSGTCPFIQNSCIKFNHDKTIIYGTCSVTTSEDDIVICPNRLYANNYQSIRNVSNDAFGSSTKMYNLGEYHSLPLFPEKCVVALGKHSGKEVQLGNSLSMDWVLALMINGHLQEYIGIEVQSLDITGNYRDAWEGYRSLADFPERLYIPASNHGLNWANVHKRIIPQLIRKGIVYSRSSFVKKGLYFVVPDNVFIKFEEIVGDIPFVDTPDKETITVQTYNLGGVVEHGKQRELILARTIRFNLHDFANSFISGPNLPSGDQLDDAVKKNLGLAN